jgi:hypothetical protein
VGIHGRQDFFVLLPGRRPEDYVKTRVRRMTLKALLVVPGFHTGWVGRLPIE